MTFVDGGATCPLAVSEMVWESGGHLNIEYRLSKSVGLDGEDIEEWVECVYRDVRALWRHESKTVSVQVASQAQKEKVKEKFGSERVLETPGSNLIMKILPP